MFKQLFLNISAKADEITNIFKGASLDQKRNAFNIMNEYLIGDILVKHYDLYRLKTSEELNDLNLFENNEKEIVLVEWPQIIKEVPKNVTKLYFEYKNDFKDRCIKIIR